MMLEYSEHIIIFVINIVSDLKIFIITFNIVFGII